MKAVVVRHLNDIVSLTVLALMAVALIAGQAEATAYGADEIVEHTVFRVEIDVRGVVETVFERGQ